MDPETFKILVESNGMTIIEQKTIQFDPLGEWNGIDCISIFKKQKNG
jgi:hypothetical protein